MLNKDNFFRKLNIMIVEMAENSYFNEDFINKFNSVIFKNNVDEAMTYYKNSIDSEKKIDIVLSQMYFSNKKATFLIKKIIN